MNQTEEQGRYASIGAVVLAAGKSLRMGQPKLMLPWGNHTVIWQIVDTLTVAGIQDVIVVTGGARDLVEIALAGTQARLVHNPEFDHSEMMRSLQTGIWALPDTCQALLVTLGDQPMIEPGVIAAVVDSFLTTRSPIVIPSYQMHRGHPWLVARRYWDDLLRMPPEQTMHDFIQAHADQIQYVNYDSPSILKDLDTPDDYRQSVPK